MIDFKQKLTVSFLKLGQREARRSAFVADVAIQIAEKHLVDGSEETLDAATPLRLARDGEHQADLEIRGHLLQVLGGEVGAVVGVKDSGHTADVPVRMVLPPNALMEGKRCSHRRRRIEAEIIAGDRAAIIVDYDGQPGPRNRSILLQKLNIQLCVIRLPNEVRLYRFAPMDQVEAFAIRFAAFMGESTEARRQFSDDVIDGPVARGGLADGLGIFLDLPVNRSDRDRMTL